MFEALRRRLEAEGCLPLSEYMALCNAEYYAGKDPLGQQGDFITAPEISPLFGEIIGAWCVAVWERMGSPPRFVLAELGAGRGTLLADVWRAAGVRPAFRAAAETHIIETSPALRDLQDAALAGLQPVWHADITDLPHGLPLLILANEFLDALPIEQEIFSDGHLRRRGVRQNKDGELEWCLLPLPADQIYNPGEKGAIREHSPARRDVFAELCGRLRQQGGAALIIDYGYTGGGAGDTLQAVSGHAFVSALQSPGDCDLTAHVDFAVLKSEAAKHGLSAYFATQRAFLLRCSIQHRLGALLKFTDVATQHSLVSGYERLTALDGMGVLFKVLGVAAPPLSLPGFDQ